MAELLIIDERPARRGAEAAAPAGAWARSSVRLTVLFLALTCCGLVMSASALSVADFASATAKRFALTAAGVCAFLFGARLHYQWWRRHSLGLLALSAAGLVLVLVPGVGAQVNGARRWIRAGLPVGFQPSEFAKLGLLVWVAAYCERNATRMGGFTRGFMIPVGVIGLVSGLVLIEPDFGTAVLIGGVCMAVLLVFGTRLVYVLLAAAAGMPLLQRLVLEVPYRMERVLTFLNPWSDPRGAGYQLIQSKIAIGSGGLFGVGPGLGLQKAGFLPGADNDFVFSVMAEELGLVGAALLILVFVFVLYEALKVSLRSRDPFGFGLALGLAILLGTQAAAHIAVVTGSVPTKGLSLPFVSAGGSSLIVSMLAGGILVSIARSEERPDDYRLRPWEQDQPVYERAAGDVAEAVGGTLRRRARRAIRRTGF